MDGLGRWRAGRRRRAARHGPQRGGAQRHRSPSHRSRYSAAGHAASGHGRSLGRGAHRSNQRIGPWIVVVGVDRQRSTVEVPHDLRRRGNRMRDHRQTGALLPLTARLMSRADTQHATTSAVGATGPATIRSSRPQRPATTRSRQETSVQPRNHGPGLRITRGYRSYSARAGSWLSQSHPDGSVSTGSAVTE
jgi:hypothetical protein